MQPPAAHFRQQVVGLATPVPVMDGERLYVNLDNAASTPALQAVMHAVLQVAPWYASVHRGTGFKSRLSTRLYEEARQIMAWFVGANPNEHVVLFGKNTTEAINKLSYRLNLRRTDIVLISHLEHHSNDLPWRAAATVRRIGLTPEGQVDRAAFLQLLHTYAGRVRLVALSGASNVTGYVPDVHWFARHAHAAGAQILVDGAQLAAHRPITMLPLDDPRHLDYVALSGHKMYAPFGAGVLAGRRDTFDRGVPEYRGGGTIRFVTDRRVEWARPPDRDEAGSPNVIGAVAMATAARTLRQWGFPAIMAHETALTSYALQRLAAIRGLTMYGSARPDDAASRVGVIPFTIASLPAQLVAAVLGHEWGIGVRAGCFCAQPYVMQLLGLGRPAQYRMRYDVLHERRDRAPGMVRISFGLYNSIQEVDTLIEALEAIVAGRYGRYTVDQPTGSYTPVGYAPDFSRYFQW